MATKNKLSIYLIKDGCENIDDLFDEKIKVAEFNRYDDDTVAYYLPSHVHEPSWLESFFHQGSNRELLQANSRLVLLKKITVENNKKRAFALTFGYARFLFKEDVFEEQFGLKIILNSIHPNQLRRISKASVGSNQKQSDEQLPKSSDISEFGFDINRDLMKIVSGKSEEEMFENSMLTGGDILSLTVNKDISNIGELLEFCYERYNDDTYKTNFSWIDNIKYVKEKKKIESLNAILLDEIQRKNFQSVWMAVPEVVAWEDIKDFKISGIDNTFDDIYISSVVDSFRNGLTDISQLCSKKICARSAQDENENAYEWTAYRCLIAEISDGTHQYCLNSGKWYRIDSSFAISVNQQYSTLEINQDPFLDYCHKDEDAYNEELCKNLNNAFLLHKYKIPIGGGQGNNLEPCDLFWNNKIIHIKKNGGSSVLSHLFNQAAVAGQAWLDKEFRNKLSRKLTDAGMLDIFTEPFLSHNFEIVMAIINDFNDERPKIPFFSKVAICYAATTIKNMGYKLSIKNIRKTH